MICSIVNVGIIHKMHVVVSQDEREDSTILITFIVCKDIACEVKSASLLSHTSGAKDRTCLCGIVVVKSVVCEINFNLIILQCIYYSIYY